MYLDTAIGTLTTPTDMDGYLARIVREKYASNARGLFNPAIEALAGAARNDMGAHVDSVLDVDVSTTWRMSRFGMYDVLLIEQSSLNSFAAYLFVLDAPEH